MLLVDALAKRYGKWPHEVLALDPEQLGYALACAQQADATRSQMVERVHPFPVVIVEP